MKDKKILVTGGAGFIGSHLIEELLRQGCPNITSIDLSNEYPDGIEEQIEIRTLRLGDPCGYEMTAHFIERIQPDVIFHLAAKNLEDSMKEYGVFLDAETTIMGTLHLLEAIRHEAKSRYPVLVFSSTGSVYGEPVHSIQVEGHPRVPTSPYGVSKLAAEEYLRVWNALFGIPFVGLRYYNVYGPRQKNGVIPVFAKRMLSGETINVTGTGQQSRCFTHVRDIVRATIMASKEPRAWNKFYNIAGHEQTNILQLAIKMMEISGANVPVVHVKKRVGEIMRFNPHITNAYHNFDYKPTVSLDEGLKDYFDRLKADLYKQKKGE